MRWRFTGNAAAKAAASAIIMPIQRVGLTRPGFGRFVSLWVRIGRTWRRWIRC
jgi:hypothetical protein